MIERKNFQKTVDGKQIDLFTLKNKNGMTVDITNYGAKVVTINVPDKNGNMADVVLGFETIDEYLEKEPFFGTICGRFANRIKDGKFSLDGKDYQLAVNNGSNHLHGGIKGFNVKVWDVVESAAQKLSLHYLSVDGEENYPGNLNVTVTYELSDDNALKIHYEATTDKPTVLGLCNHSYFNLKGAGEGTVRDHYLQIEGDFHTVLDETAAPTGEIKPVAGSPFDFRKSTLIESVIDDAAFVPGRGLDNNWTVRKKFVKELALAATLYEPKSGRKMEAFTTQPGIQIYSGNWIEKNTGKYGKKYDEQDAICLEAQGFPNSPNVAHFPSSVLRPGEKYDEWCIYKFSAE